VYKRRKTIRRNHRNKLFKKRRYYYNGVYSISGCLIKSKSNRINIPVRPPIEDPREDDDNDES